MFNPFRLFALTRGNLRRKRHVYVSLTVGIVFAVTFVAVIAFVLMSLPASFKARHIKLRGYADVVINDISDDELTKYLSNGWIEEVGLATVIGHCADEESREGAGFNVASLDQTALKLLDLKVAEGRLPEKTGEIALEYGAFSVLRQSYKVGDEVTLKLFLPAGGGRIYQDKAFDFTFTLVGLVENKNSSEYMFPSSRSDRTNPFSVYPYAYVSSGQETEAGAVPVRTAYLTLSPAFRKIIASTYTYDFAATYMRGAFIIGDGLLSYFMEPYNHLRDTVILVSLVFIALVTAAAIGIANSLNVVLEERRQQTGLLRAVGMTKRQLCRLYRRETELITLIALPAALLLAAGIVRMLSFVMDGFVFSVHPLSVPAVIVFSAVVIFIAGYFPIKRSSEMPPMQAIRNVEAMRKLTGKKKIRSQRIFGPARLLTRRNIQLYRGQRIGVSIFLILSLLMSMWLAILSQLAFESLTSQSADFALVDYEDREYRHSPVRYDYLCPGYSDRTVHEIESLPLVDRVEAQKELNIHILVDKVTPYLEPETVLSAKKNNHPDLNRHWRELNEHYGLDGAFTLSRIQAFSERDVLALADFLYEGRLDLESMNRGESVLLCLPAYELEMGDDGVRGMKCISQNVMPRADTEVLRNDVYELNENLRLRLMYTEQDMKLNEQRQEVLPDDVTVIEREAKVTGFIDFIDFMKNRSIVMPQPGAVVTTFEGLEAMGLNCRVTSIIIYLSETPDPVMAAYLVEQLTEMTYETKNGELMNYLAYRDSSVKESIKTLFGLASILIVFMSICISMISHNVTNRIKADKRVIGTMRAVGAPERVLQQSIFGQIVSYFVPGTIISSVFGLVYYFVNRQKYCGDVRSSLLPLVTSYIFVLVMAAITVFNARRKVSRIFKKSIVDNIRQLTSILIAVATAAILIFRSLPVSAVAASPKLLITDYAIAGQQETTVSAGMEAVLTFTVENVQADQLARNIVVTCSSKDEHIVPRMLANTYIDMILAWEKSDVNMPIRILEEATPGVKELTIAFEFQDIGGVNYSSSQNVYLTVVQDVRLEHDALDYVPKLVQGNVGRFNLNLMNMGKGSVNNVLIKSQIPGISEGVSAFVGTIEAGKSAEASLNILIRDRVEPGHYSGHMELIYEGMAGETYTEMLPLELDVSKKQDFAAVAGNDDEDKEMTFSLPWMIGAGTIIIFLLILLTVQCRTIRKLKKAEEARL